MNLKHVMVVLAIYAIASGIALIPLPASSQAQRGPVIDRLRLKVIRSPDAEVLAMQTREIDSMVGMIRPTDIETLQGAGKSISSTPGYHFCNFMFNMRPTLLSGARNPLHDVNFRHALFHLMPKARIIGSQFRYIVGQVDSIVPPSQAEWYNSYVDPHPFSDPAILGENAESVKILKAAGYLPVGSWPYTGWTFSDGTPLPTIRVYVPLEATAPTSFQVGKMWTDQVHLIGLNNVVNSPEEFSAYLIKMYDQWDFEVGWSCYALGRFPDYLYESLHSSENYPGSSNPHGIYWTALDNELYTLKFGTDHALAVAAAKKAQELIMGGTPGTPLPYPYDVNGFYNWSLPRLAVYSRNYYDAQQPEMRGAVNMRGQGIDIMSNPFTPLSIHWNPVPAGRTDPDGAVFINWLVDEYPEKLNILWSKTVYAAVFYQMYEGLLTVNPWTGSDMPWIADNWEYHSISVPGQPQIKQYVKFWLRNDVTWQTGEAFTINDVAFAWNFIKTWQIPKYFYFTQYIDHVETNPAENSVTAFMTRTSMFDIYDLAGTAALLPSRVWANNPVTGNPWTDVVEITGFDPAQPWVGGPLPTYLYGTGAFIFKFYNPTAAYGDLDANRNYWQTTAQILSRINYYFWRAGDTDQSGKVYAEDMASIGSNWGATGVPLGPPGPDITGYLGSAPDGKVDLEDLVMAAGFFGETVTVPWP